MFWPVSGELRNDIIQIQFDFNKQGRWPLTEQVDKARYPYFMVEIVTIDSAGFSKNPGVILISAQLL